MYIGTAVLSLGIPVRLSPPPPLTPPRPAAEGCARRQGPCKLMLGILFWLHGLRAIFWIWLGVMPPLTLFAAMYMLPIPPIFGTNPTWSPVRPPQANPRVRSEPLSCAVSLSLGAGVGAGGWCDWRGCGAAHRRDGDLQYTRASRRLRPLRMCPNAPYEHPVGNLYR